MDQAAEKFVKAEVKDLWGECMREHNYKWNPTGAAYEKRTIPNPEESGRPAKQARTIEMHADGPIDLKMLEEKKGKFVSFQAQGQKVCITLNGEMWIWGLSDGEMNDSDALALVWGEFKLNEEATKLLQANPLRVWAFKMNTVDHKGGYSMKSASPAMEFQPNLRKLSELLKHL